jgi:hypothetical protein
MRLPSLWQHPSNTDPRLFFWLSNNYIHCEQNSLFIQTRRKMIDLRSAVARERLELNILMDKETMDEDAVKGQFKKLGRAGARLAAERFRFILTVKAQPGFKA